jgi:hypothetical protein
MRQAMQQQQQQQSILHPGGLGFTAGFTACDGLGGCTVV